MKDYLDNWQRHYSISPTAMKALQNILDAEGDGGAVGEDEEQLGRDDVTLRLIDAIEERDHLRSVLATHPARSGVVSDEDVEIAAKAIFLHWQFKSPVPWIAGGNSLMQGVARDYARAALESYERNRK